MAVREENVARSSLGVKGYAIDCGGISTATTARLALQFSRFQAQAPIVEFPVIDLPQTRTGGRFNGSEVIGAPCCRHLPDKGLAEHSDPVGQALLAVLQRRRTVEQNRPPYLQAVLLKQGGILG